MLMLILPLLGASDVVADDELVLAAEATPLVTPLDVVDCSSGTEAADGSVWIVPLPDDALERVPAFVVTDAFVLMGVVPEESEVAVPMAEFRRLGSCPGKVILGSAFPA